MVCKGRQHDEIAVIICDKTLDDCCMYNRMGKHSYLTVVNQRSLVIYRNKTNKYNK